MFPSCFLNSFPPFDLQLYLNSNIHRTLVDVNNHIFAFNSNCLLELKSWFSLNFLKLSSDKTEILLIGARSTFAALNNSSMSINHSTAPPSPQVKSLGVLLDSTLSFEAHINNVTWSAYFHQHMQHQQNALVHLEGNLVIINQKQLIYNSSFKEVRNDTKVQNYGPKHKELPSKSIK